MLSTSTQQPDNPVQGSSNRSFGLVFTTVFAIIGLWPLLSSDPIRTWSLGISLALVFVSFLVPGLLTVPNRLWTRFGLLLHKITNPLLMGILFVLVFVPMAIWLRLARRQPIKRMTGSEDTFWRNPGSTTVDPDSFRKLY